MEKAGRFFLKAKRFSEKPFGFSLEKDRKISQKHGKFFRNNRRAFPNFTGVI